MSAILQSYLLQDVCYYICIILSPSLPVCLCSSMIISQSPGTFTESIADQSTSLCLLQAVRDNRYHLAVCYNGKKYAGQHSSNTVGIFV